MQWGTYEGTWVAQGRGRRWTVVEHPTGEGQGEVAYSLWSAPLENLTAQTAEASDCPSLEDAKRHAEESPPQG